jgi:hypothetical protein
MAQLSVKREQIEKSRMTMLSFASAAIFLFIFSIITGHSLWGKMSFQSQVISADTAARNQLQKDDLAANALENSYISFNDANTNLLKVPVTGVSNDNAKIILDSLPSSYDYPALTSSLEALLGNQGVKVDSIGGTDESGTVSTSSNSQPVAMPFTFTVDGPYQNIQNLINEFQLSIRPFQIQTLVLSGSQSDVNLNVNAQTYFQPASQFNITTKEVN